MATSAFSEKEPHACQTGITDVEDAPHGPRGGSVVTRDGEIVNASGHRDQLRRQYGLLSVCGLALTIDNAWIALGGSLTVSICKYSLASSQITLTRSSEWRSSRNPV